MSITYDKSPLLTTMCVRCHHPIILHLQARLKDGSEFGCYSCDCVKFAKDNFDFIEQEAKLRGL